MENRSSQWTGEKRTTASRGEDQTQTDERWTLAVISVQAGRGFGQVTCRALHFFL